MLRILIFLLIGIVMAQDKLNMPYDFSRHQGYVINNGSIMWNEDWSSGNFFFDGTFANYPSKFGPQIESGYFNSTIDSTLSDSDYTTSYFDYIQGDYYLDNLDIGLEYSTNNKKTSLNGFKKRYAGAYNQYDISPAPPKPIQYTYLGTYSSKINNNKIDIAIGNFNSDFGLFDTLGTAYIDSRITSSNFLYRRDYNSAYFTINAHNFLQRYNSIHSEALTESVRYLTRTKFLGSINWIKHNNYTFSILTSISKRSLRSDSFRSVGWNTIKIRIANTNYSFNLGRIELGSNFKFIMDGKARYNIGRSLFTSSFNHNFGSSHNSLTNTMFLEQKDQFILSGQWSQKKINAGVYFYFNSYKRDPNSLLNGILPDDGSNIWFSGTIKYRFIDHHFFVFSYDKMKSNNYITDGIEDRVKIKFNNHFKLFSSSMGVHTSLSFSGFLNRYSDYLMHPTEQYPVKIMTEEPLENIWLIDFSIVCIVKNLQLKYEMNNIANIIYDYLGSNNEDYSIQFNPYFPKMRSLASLSIKWDFLD